MRSGGYHRGTADARRGRLTARSSPLAPPGRMHLRRPAGAAALTAQVAAAVLPRAAQGADGDAVIAGLTTVDASTTWAGAPRRTRRSGASARRATGSAWRARARTSRASTGSSAATPRTTTPGCWARRAPASRADRGGPDSGGALGSASAGARATGTTVVLALVVDGTAAFKRCGLAPVPAGKCSVRSSGHTFGPLPEHGFAMLQAYRGGVAVAATVIDSKAGAITIYPTKKVTTATPITWYLFAPSRTPRCDAFAGRPWGCPRSSGRGCTPW